MANKFRYSRTLPANNYLDAYPDLLIDDDCAMMTQFDFDRLTDYSGSLPTGITIGKCWKDGGRLRQRYALGYYEDCDPPEEKTVFTQYRPIIIV